MFDIHIHAVPRVDDGAGDLKQSIRMIKQAVAEGVTDMILTPHFSHHYAGREDLRNQNMAELMCECEKQKLPVQLYRGNEVLYEPGALSSVQNGKALTLAGSQYVLIEFPEIQSFRDIKQAVHDFRNAGYRPLLAHVERYVALQGKMERINELIGMGAYMQMNTDDIPGGRFNSYSRWCRRLIKDQKISFLGSDAHNDIERAPRYKKAVDFIQKACGEEYLSKLTTENPEKIIRNTYL